MRGIYPSNKIDSFPKLAEHDPKEELCFLFYDKREKAATARLLFTGHYSAVPHPDLLFIMT